MTTEIESIKHKIQEELKETYNLKIHDIKIL